MIHLLVTLLAVLSVVGVVMNNYRRKACFLLWMVSNAGYVLIDVCYTGLPERAVQHLIFLGLAVHGYREWGRANTSQSK